AARRCRARPRRTACPAARIRPAEAGSMTAAPLPEPFPATRYLIGGIVRRRLHFPHYAGPALRGAFGHALRQLNCITGHDDCTGCRARTACTYAAVFEPPPPPAMHRPRQRIPPPYVLEPPPGAITLEP